VYAFHRETFLRHGNEPYLTREFFGEIGRTMGDALMVKVAVRQASHGAAAPSSPVAAAIFFWSPQALYGRYWGAAAEYHSLHFETCYHQGIEFCIERGIPRFEPGTQGEHKLSRGFEPALTWSAHYIADEAFREAIGEYLEREGEAIDDYAAQVQDHVPYRKGPA
jgi:predicted N-acyltransferase